MKDLLRTYFRAFRQLNTDIEVIDVIIGILSFPFLILPILIGMPLLSFVNWLNKND